MMPRDAPRGRLLSFLFCNVVAAPLAPPPVMAAGRDHLMHREFLPGAPGKVGPAALTCRSSTPCCSLVVLIHSLGTYSAVWDDLVETLEDSGFLILRYDLLGMGFSGKAPVRNYAPKNMTLQLENLMRDLGVTARTYDMIGHGVIDRPFIHL